METALKALDAEINADVKATMSATDYPSWKLPAGKAANFFHKFDRASQ